MISAYEDINNKSKHNTKRSSTNKEISTSNKKSTKMERL